MLKLAKSAIMILAPADRGRLVLAVFINLVIAAVEAVGLALLLPLLQGLMTGPEKPGQLSLIAKLQGLDQIPSHMLAAAIFALFLVKNVFAVFLIRWQLRFLNEAEAGLAKRLMSVYLRAPFHLHLERNPAELMRNINGTGSVIGSFLLPMLSILSEGAVLVASLAMMTAMQPVAALSFLAFMGLATLGFQHVLKAHLSALGKEQLSLNFLLVKSINQGLGGIRETTVLERRESFIDVFVTQRDRSAIVRTSQLFLLSLQRYYLETILLVGLAAMATGLTLVYTAAEAATLLGVFGIIGLRMLPSINRIMTYSQQMRTAAATVDVVCHEFANLPATQVGAPPLPPPPAPDGLMIKGVHFAYPGQPAPILKGIDLLVPWKSSLGIVGGSGAGKSTLVDLILGLLEPEEGWVLADGKDIRADMHAWHRRLGYIPQSIYLADETLRQNIALGVPPAEIDEARIRAVLRQARLEEVVGQMPEGLETMLGDRGVRLSGGQRQRVGIARALYHDPEVLILDEATSALDNETESEIASTIDSLSQSKTLLVIAHRLSTIQHCSKIVYMENGEIRASGTFKELAANHDAFARMIQAGNLQLDIDQNDIGR